MLDFHVETGPDSEDVFIMGTDHNEVKQKSEECQKLGFRKYGRTERFIYSAKDLSETNGILVHMRRKR